MTDEVINNAAPAPAPAPAPTPAPAPAPAGDQPQPDSADSGFEYAEVEGDPGLTMALKFVGSRGIGPDSPEMQAAMQGDFSYLKAALASLGSKAQGFEAVLALAEKSWEKHVSERTEQVQATHELLVKEVGSPETWNEIKAWAGEHAEPEEKTAINAMLDAGGFQARAAAAFLAKLYHGAAGTSVEPAPATKGAPAASAAPFGTPLDDEAFAAEVSKLVRSHGVHGYRNSPEFAALQARVKRR